MELQKSAELPKSQMASYWRTALAAAVALWPIAPRQAHSLSPFFRPSQISCRVTLSLISPTAMHKRARAPCPAMLARVCGGKPGRVPKKLQIDVEKDAEVAALVMDMHAARKPSHVSRRMLHYVCRAPGSPSARSDQIVFVRRRRSPGR